MALPTLPRPFPGVSRLIWLAITAGAALFLGVAALVRWNNPLAVDPSLVPVVWIALLVAAGGLVASRALAARAPSSDADRARSRMVFQMVLCESGALLGGVAWFLTGNPWSWAAAAIGMIGIALAYPRAAAVPGRPNAMMR